ncbi:hypothetical protein ACHAQA_006854 [Verticillium albo-atrum]
MSFPTYDDLPAVDGMPRGCAWGVFDKDGRKDVFGTLNHLTPETTKAAAAEVRDGVSISLNWPLNALEHIPLPGRRKLAHTVMPLRDAGVSGGIGWDDELHFNTQGSSQWDSLVHWQHQASGLAYNGWKPTQEELSRTSTAENAMPTLDHWHSRGGLVARGVLIDFVAYAEAKGIEFHPFDGYRITVEEIEDVARHQGVEFRPGDVFLLRLGSTDAFANPTPEGMAKLAQMRLSGVHGIEATAKWFWDKKFAAVATDANAFEAVPPVKEDGSVGSFEELVLHEYFLSFFGMPIGELWDLAKLAEYCKEKGRYTFMLTSSPLNAPCLVGSPPNALAIF